MNGLSTLSFIAIRSGSEFRLVTSEFPDFYLRLVLTGFGAKNTVSDSFFFGFSEWPIPISKGKLQASTVRHFSSKQESMLVIIIIMSSVVT